MKPASKQILTSLALIGAGMVLIPASKLFASSVPQLKSYFLNLQLQLPDLRDLHISDIFSFINEDETPLPPTVDLRAKCPPIYDQKTLGSCTGCVGAAAFTMASGYNILPSILFQYYNERLIEGKVNIDSGSQMRNIGKALTNYGICKAEYFPYDITKFTNTPSQAAYQDAANFKIKAYYSLTNLAQIRQTLLLSQKPVLALIQIYDSFQNTPKSGMMSMPSGNSLGNHAILIVGYSDAGKYLICRNSWGTGFGAKGYFYMPYDYVNQGLSQDFWYLDYKGNLQ
jgi:C1A family cysteine protease